MLQHDHYTFVPPSDPEDDVISLDLGFDNDSACNSLPPVCSTPSPRTVAHSPGSMPVAWLMETKLHNHHITTKPVRVPAQMTQSPVKTQPVKAVSQSNLPPKLLPLQTETRTASVSLSKDLPLHTETRAASASLSKDLPNYRIPSKPIDVPANFSDSSGRFVQF